MVSFAKLNIILSSIYRYRSFFLFFLKNYINDNFIKITRRDSGTTFLSFVEISEMDANIEEVSGRIAIGMSVSRESRYLSTATKGKASAQTLAMDLRPLRQIFLRRKTLGCPFR